jgi:hypothetical protein
VYLYLLCFVLFVPGFYIVSLMYIYTYLFCLYWCKDYCHRVTTELQLIIIIIIIIIIILKQLDTIRKKGRTTFQSITIDITLGIIA